MRPSAAIVGLYAAGSSRCQLPEGRTWFRPFATALGVLRYGQMMSEGILFDRDAVDQLHDLSDRPRRLRGSQLLWVDVHRESRFDGAEIGKGFALDDTTCELIPLLGHGRGDHRDRAIDGRHRQVEALAVMQVRLRSRFCSDDRRPPTLGTCGKRRVPPAHPCACMLHCTVCGWDSALAARCRGSAVADRLNRKHKRRRTCITAECFNSAMASMARSR